LVVTDNHANLVFSFLAVTRSWRMGWTI